jgi:hypothetical protein
MIIMDTNQDQGSEEITNTEGDGTQEELSSEGNSSEQSQSSEKSEDVFTDEKLDDDDLGTWTPEKLKEKHASFQRDYTKKTTSFAESRKQYESQIANTEQRLSQYQQMVVDVLKDPNKLEAYRKVYGPQLGITTTQQEAEDIAPQLETVEDLTRHLEERDRRLEQKLREEIAKENSDYRSNMQTQSRWETAVQSLKSDPVFGNENFRSIIVQMVQDPSRPYIGDYKRGILTETGVLQKGIEEFKRLLGPELKKAKQSGAGIAAKKTAVGTEKPAKSVATTPAKSLTKEQIIARVQSTLGT